ncbi:hypothetical protein BsWGS_00983 [Bradybaena similaris]
MVCNNTTYMQVVLNSTELMLQYHKYAFFVNTLNYNIPTAMTINKCVTPVWIFVGVLGNIVSTLIWASPRMRTCNTVAYYLTCLAIADLIFLFLHLIYELENPWLLGTLDVQGWCQLFSMAYIAVQYFCVFLVFAFTVERFLSVCHPFKSEKFSKTRTPRVIFALFVLALVLSIPQGYFWIINKVGECQVRPSEMKPPSASFFSVYTWCSELAVFLALPLIVLILNIVVCHKIRRVGTLQIGKSSSMKKDARTPLTAHEVKPSTLTVEDDSPASKRLSRTNGGYNASNKGPTVTLLWVSFYLIITVLPNTFLYAMQPFVGYGVMPCSLQDMSEDPTWSAYFLFAAIKTIVKEVSLSHHVGNVFIYMATSRRFLRLCIQNFCPRTKHCRSESTKDTSLQTMRITHSRSMGVDV